MLKKLSPIIISLLLLNPTTVYALGEDNARLQLLLQKAKARSSNAKQVIKAIEQATPPAIKQEIIKPPITKTPVQEQSIKPIQEWKSVPPVSQEPIRKPVVLETHPAAKPAPATSAPVPTAPAPTTPKAPAAIAKPEPVKTQIKQETKVVQPPAKTLIQPAASPAPIKTVPVKNSTIEVKHAPAAKPVVIETHHPEPIAEPVIEEKSTVVEQDSSLGQVTDFLDSLLNQPTGTKTIPEIDLNEAEQAMIEQKSIVPVVKEVTEPIIKEPIISNETIPAVPEPKVTKEQEIVTEAKAPVTEQAISLSQQESDYLLVVRRSLKSLEDDPWTKVKSNMDEALDYFAKEQEIHKDKDLNIYHKIILACKKFSEGGLELDEGDFANFEEAEALYLDTQDLLKDVSKQIKDKTDYQSTQIQEIVTALMGYTNEELEYIEEMLGM